MKDFFICFLLIFMIFFGLLGYWLDIFQQEENEIAATIVSMQDNIVLFETENGDFWKIESADISAYDKYGYYKLIIKSNEVIKIYREVW